MVEAIRNGREHRPPVTRRTCRGARLCDRIAVAKQGAVDAAGCVVDFGEGNLAQAGHDGSPISRVNASTAVARRLVVAKIHCPGLRECSPSSCTMPGARPRLSSTRPCSEYPEMASAGARSGWPRPRVPKSDQFALGSKSAALCSLTYRGGGPGRGVSARNRSRASAASRSLKGLVTTANSTAMRSGSSV